MTEREQRLLVCRQNRDLTRENGRLRDELRRTDQECRDLRDANANLRVERDATDVLLGETMDELLSKDTR
jgi:hypothetical protein